MHTSVTLAPDALHAVEGDGLMHLKRFRRDIDAQLRLPGKKILVLRLIADPGRKGWSHEAARGTLARNFGIRFQNPLGIVFLDERDAMEAYRWANEAVELSTPRF